MKRQKRLLDYFGHSNKKSLSKINTGNQVTKYEEENNDETATPQSQSPVEALTASLPAHSATQEHETTTPQSQQPVEATQESIKKKVTQHLYQDSWAVNYQWLFRRDNTTTAAMFCKLCIDHKKQNPMTIGCTNFRTTTIQRHAVSKDHTEDHTHFTRS